LLLFNPSHPRIAVIERLEKEEETYGRPGARRTLLAGAACQAAYADKNRPFEHYAPAHRLGFEAALEHRKKNFEKIADEIALNYDKARPGGAVPWDHAGPAVKAAWDRLGGILGPRDVHRGVRSGF
jgi:hypothetical protein